ncbi:ribosomal-processing cysteine protease Prp [Pullulanibacillus sp. KACC 23026]|uniref:ribosomal-processing cysteine protease Prp n=1 Tax=Pullulanibacillus sp. KACC 23026 TaxID=3028315 RepID=UPI0023B14106|nr:ribosomal-processing cysteine protease Prp [Pullulanibacillus sp. KACC 23026]WEG14059.1 ribosomal-processing cysteine protease Prp [Pullulanibacillus sp. KACC 23026]
MIQVLIERRDHRVSLLEVKGHAESGPYGYDLVCAGVSSVVFGGINALIELAGYEPDIDQAADGGYIRLTVPSNLTETERERTQLLLEGLIISIKTIVASYGEHIQVREEEV